MSCLKIIDMKRLLDLRGSTAHCEHVFPCLKTVCEQHFVKIVSGTGRLREVNLSDRGTVFRRIGYT